MQSRKEIQSEREMKLHRRFEFWDEATTFTRYLMVFLLGIALYDFHLNSTFLVFAISLLMNGVCYYSMKTTLQEIVEERKRNN